MQSEFSLNLMNMRTTGTYSFEGLCSFNCRSRHSNLFSENNCNTFTQGFTRCKRINSYLNTTVFELNRRTLIKRGCK